MRGLHPSRIYDIRNRGIDILRRDCTLTVGILFDETGCFRSEKYIFMLVTARSSRGHSVPGYGAKKLQFPIGVYRGNI